MSDAKLHAAFDHSRATGPAFAVLLALADFHNDREGMARPSLAQLARKARVSRRTAARAVLELVRLGELTIVSRHAAGAVSHYRVALQDSRGSRVHGVPDRHTPSATQAHPPGQIDTPPVPDRHTPSATQAQGMCQTDIGDVPEWHGEMCQSDTQTDQGEQISEQIRDRSLDHCADPLDHSAASAVAPTPVPVAGKPALIVLWRAAFGRAPTAMQLGMLDRYQDAAASAGLPGLIDACIKDCGERGKDAAYLKGMIEGCITDRRFPGAPRNAPTAAPNRQNNRPTRLRPYQQTLAEKQRRADSSYDDSWALRENITNLLRAGRSPEEIATWGPEYAAEIAARQVRAQ